jgi:hypothetical protein
MLNSPFLANLAAAAGGAPGFGTLPLTLQLMQQGQQGPQIPLLPGMPRGGAGPVPSIPPAPQPGAGYFSSLINDPSKLLGLLGGMQTGGGGSLFGGPAAAQGMTWLGADPFTYGPLDAGGFAGLMLPLAGSLA